MINKYDLHYIVVKENDFPHIETKSSPKQISEKDPLHKLIV